MTATTTTNVGTQVYRVYIKATPQAIWDAITSPDWAVRYGYTAVEPSTIPICVRAPHTAGSRARRCDRWVHRMSPSTAR
jgi:hypothetical protein